MSSRYPDDPTVGFSPPPVEFRDREGRPIAIRTLEPAEPGHGRAGDGSADRSGGGDGAETGSEARAEARAEAEVETVTGPGAEPESAGNAGAAAPTGRDGAANAARAALVDMYDAFDPADRAQGIPPSGRDRVRDWLDTVLAPDCYNVVAWDRGRDPGRAVGHATLVPDDDAYELAIFVLQRYQEAGIGTRLLRALLGHGRASGVRRVWLSVERWNRAAIALYRNIGFETVGEGGFEQVMTLRLADGDENRDGHPDQDRDRDQNRGRG